MRIVELAICTGKWIYLLFVRLTMACNLPAMIYSAPKRDEEIELDFGQRKQPSVRRKTRLKNRDDDNEESYSNWNILPDLLLEEIFSMLTIRERYSASQVCKNWNRIFYSKRVWNTFILTDRTLTRRKFNYYLGDQYILDHFRTQLCFNRVSRGFRRIIIKPMENFCNLYEFMTLLSFYCENYEQLNLINTIDFTFGADLVSDGTVQDNSDKVFGTGGKILQALKNLMDDLIGLKHLALQDLLLEKEEAEYLLDNVAYNCCESLRTLKLVNCSRRPFPLLHTVVFINLQSLTITPQHLNDEIVEMISNTKLSDLKLLQTKLTPHCSAVSYKVWRECSKKAPKLKVHHIMDEGVKAKIIWQEGAAVKSMVYNNNETEVSIPSIFSASNFYYNTLEVLAFMGLPDYSMQDSFEDRADTALMLLSKTCPYIDTLVIRDNISTATLILIALQSKNIRRLIVRKFGLIKKCDWSHNPEWTDSFYTWLKRTSASYDSTASELSKILKYKWSPLSDEEFIKFCL